MRSFFILSALILFLAVELGGEYEKMISEEFLEQSISYRDSPGYTRDEPSDEDEDQQYHQHD